MAKTTDEEGFVTFLDSEGNEISNDPRWLAKKTLEDAGFGVSFNQSQPIQANTRMAQAAGVSNDDDDELGEDDEDRTEDYKSYSGSELKKLANARGVDISGLKKVGEVRKALMAADEKATGGTPATEGGDPGGNSGDDGSNPPPADTAK